MLSLLLAAFVTLFGGRAQPEPERLHYRIRPVPAADRTNLEISLRFSAGGAGPFRVRLPADCFGTPDIRRYVTTFEAEAGAVVGPGEKADERVVTPAPDGTVALRYVLSYDPEVMDDYPYAPNTSASHFHVAGCQWLLRVGDEARERVVSVEVVDAPKGWKLYSTVGPDAARFEAKSSHKKLVSSAVGGGANGYTFRVRGRPVSVFVHGRFDLPAREIFSAVERIVRLERRWFSDYEQPFYHVVVAPRPGVTAGYAPRNAFINFVRTDITRDELNLLLAHEMFHYWLPGKIEIRQDPKYLDVRYEWFFEGFTDYFAPRILVEAGLITTRKFAEQLNRAALNIADNPHRSETYSDFVAAALAGKFDSTYKKLSYHRGALIALNWETRLRRAGRGRDLSDFIRGLYLLARKTGGKVPEQEFFDFAAGLGLDARGDFERHILRGEPIRIEPDARVGDYEPREVEHRLFSPGFFLGQTQKAGKVFGVTEGGPAHRAGLRDGMEFVRAENANRFSNSWRADRPLVVVVKLDGRERAVEFFPHGKAERLVLLRPRGDTRRAR